jgi:hypothetical protein
VEEFAARILRVIDTEMEKAIRHFSKEVGDASSLSLGGCSSLV